DLARKIEAQGGKRGTSRQDLSPTCLFKRTSILYKNLSVNENLLAFHSFCIFLKADLLPLSHGQYVQISFQKFARNPIM
ncbi:MAG: hypothetical protein AAF443_08280, partial [Chlamydiota bacterium]